MISRQWTPAQLRRFHGWATVAWALVSIPAALLWGDSVIFVTWLSLYAVVTGHWSAWQAARTEERQEGQEQP